MSRQPTARGATPPAAERALAGRRALISGGSRGLGLAIAQRFVAAGASVLITARGATALEAAAASLAAAAAPGQRIERHAADISRPQEAQAAVDAACASLGGLDILVSNAGIAGPIGAADEVDWASWLRTVEVNLLGSVLLCRAVLPHFRRQARGKIIQLSGGGATRALPLRSAYAVSKAAVVRFVETLAEETRAQGIEVNAIAPGALNTRMLEELLAAGRERLGPAAHAALLAQRDGGGVPLARGAELALFLASDAGNGISGRLISAVWDRWQDLPQHAAALGAGDIYTLRRIVPADRGLDWDETP